MHSAYTVPGWHSHQLVPGVTWLEVEVGNPKATHTGAVLVAQTNLSVRLQKQLHVLKSVHAGFSITSWLGLRVPLSFLFN